MRKARQLDPNATIDDENHHYTQDHLAAELLYYESETYLLTAGALPVADNDDLKWVYKHYKKALYAAERALKYAPENPGVVMQYANCLHLNKRKRDARKVLKEARKKWPDDIELIKLSGKVS